MTMDNNPATRPFRQRFTVACPRASAITLVGDFTRWHENPLFLQKREDELWTVNVDLAVGTYHFRIVIDQEPDTGPDDIFEIPGPDGQAEPIHRTV